MYHINCRLYKFNHYMCPFSVIVDVRVTSASDIKYGYYPRVWMNCWWRISKKMRNMPRRWAFRNVFSQTAQHEMKTSTNGWPIIHISCCLPWFHIYSRHTLMQKTLYTSNFLLIHMVDILRYPGGNITWFFHGLWLANMLLHDILVREEMVTFSNIWGRTVFSMTAIWQSACRLAKLSKYPHAVHLLFRKKCIEIWTDNNILDPVMKLRR